MQLRAQDVLTLEELAKKLNLLTVDQERPSPPRANICLSPAHASHLRRVTATISSLDTRLRSRIS